MEENGKASERDKDRESSFTRIYEGKTELPQVIREEVREVSCLSYREDQQVYLLKEENGRRSILKTAGGKRMELLEEEGENLRKLHASFIPQMYSCFRENDRVFLWKEYIEGETLYERVERSGPLGERETAGIMVRLCEMLSQFHKCTPPLIHRDLKPQNIVITPEENLFLIDLETVREYRETASHDTVFIATRQTAAPEQYGFRQTDCRTDVYSLGMICLYLLTGSTDVQRDEILALLSPAFLQVIKTCTKLDPAERYQNCGELKAALKVAGQGSLPGAPGVKRKKRRIAAAAAVCAAGLCFLAGIGLWQNYMRINGEYHFASELIEQAVRQQLGKEEGKITEADLRLVDSLRICGDEIMGADTDRHFSLAAYHSINDQTVETWGNIRSLKDCAHMKNLHTLILDRQRIRDISPLEGLPLISVSLCANEISDVSPLAQCENLQELYLDQTSVNSLTPLSGLASLKWLDVSNIRSADLADLPAQKLEALYLLNTRTENEEELAALPLKVLHIDYTEGIEKTVGKIETLETLNVSGYPFSDLEPLSGLKKLSDLTLSSGGLTDLKGAEKLTALRRLAIDGTDTSDLSPLKNCVGLENLSVCDTNVMDFGTLAELKNLKSLYCDETQEAAVREAVPDPWFSVSVNQRTRES